MAAVCVFCASSGAVDPRWLLLAEQAGRELARRGHSLVSGGARVGMMGTVAGGARSAGAPTLGVMPQSLVDLEIADTAATELVITTRMADRKVLMVEKSDAFLTLPGGLGTMDELFEVWTLATLGLHDKPVVLVNMDGFYQGLIDWLAGLTAAGFVRPQALGRLIAVDSVTGALDEIERRLDASRAG